MIVNKFGKKIIGMAKTLTPMEWLLIIFGSWAIWQIAIFAYDHLAAPLILQESSTILAGDIREAEVTARQRHTSIDLMARPMGADHPAGYALYGGGELILERQLPGGVNIAGHVRIDAEGIPSVAEVFKLRKGGQVSKVVIEPNGDVSVP